MDVRRRMLFNSVDTTYAIYYTSSDGNVITPYSTNVFGANIVSNNYINGQGIISFDGPVTEIGYRAFYKCSTLTSVTIPDSVTEIGGSAFWWCANLKNVTIPDSVTTIGNSAFRYCESLTSVTIPDSVTSIEALAFNNCDIITSVYCKATTPPALGSASVFTSNGSGRKIYVPVDAVEAYKSASYWRDYADDIVGYEFEDDGDSVNLITFTIDETEYQAEEGMTWSEWVDSEYNSGNFGIDFDNTIGYGVSDIFIAWIGTNEDYVYATDIIQEGYDYFLVK